MFRNWKAESMNEYDTPIIAKSVSRRHILVAVVGLGGGFGL